MRFRRGTRRNEMKRVVLRRGDALGFDGKYLNKTHVEFDYNSLIPNQNIHADHDDTAEAKEGFLANLFGNSSDQFAGSFVYA